MFKDEILPGVARLLSVDNSFVDEVEYGAMVE
jgi:hypothetical protein